MSTGWSLVNSPLDMADDQAVINEAKRWMKLAEPLRRKPSGLHKRK